MSEYEIKCRHCNNIIDHVCDESFREALLRLLTWIPEGGFSGYSISDYTNIGEVMRSVSHKFESDNAGHDLIDCTDMPFFGSQSWSYLLFWKEEARTFHALLRNMMDAAGIDGRALCDEALRKGREGNPTYEQICKRREACEHTKMVETNDDRCFKCGYTKRVDYAPMVPTRDAVLLALGNWGMAKDESDSFSDEGEAALEALRVFIEKHISVDSPEIKEEQKRSKTFFTATNVKTETHAFTITAEINDTKENRLKSWKVQRAIEAASKAIREALDET